MRITAIVPTWNEEATVGASIESLRAAGMDQVLVVDGGSRDRTVAVAAPLADKVLEASGGLFRQLDHAAREAGGDVFLFHYADVELPRTGRKAIEDALARPRAAGGAFRLAFASSRPRYSVIAAFANWRNRLGLGPFGDQSIFVRAEVYRSLGGFDTGALLPDLDLVRRLRRAGVFVIASDPVRASARKWERNGLVRTLLSHWRLLAADVLRRGRAPGGRAGEADSTRTAR